VLRRVVVPRGPDCDANGCCAVESLANASSSWQSNAGSCCSVPCGHIVDRVLQVKLPAIPNYNEIYAHARLAKTVLYEEPLDCRTPVLLVGNLTIDIVDKKKALVSTTACTIDFPHSTHVEQNRLSMSETIAGWCNFVCSCCCYSVWRQVLHCHSSQL